MPSQRLSQPRLTDLIASRSPAGKRVTVIAAGWLGVALVAFGLLACNPGYGYADELELLHGSDSFGAVCRAFLHQVVDPGDLFYRPVGLAALRLQLLLDRFGAHAVHVASTLHHCVNAALFASLLRALGARCWPAIWFLALPTAIPGIAWVAAVYDRLLVTWLLLGALMLTSRSRSLVLGSCCMFVLALMTKETSVVFAPVAAVCARRSKCAAIASGQICALAVGFVIWRLPYVPRVGDYSPKLSADLGTQLMRYVAFPFALGADDPRTVWAARWLPGLGGTAVLGAAAWVQSRSRYRALFVGPAFLTVTPLLPVLFQTQVSGHYLYPGSVGFACLLDRVRAGRGAVLSVLLAMLGTHSVMVAAHWRRTGQAMNALLAAHAGLREQGVREAAIGLGAGGDTGPPPRFVTYVRDLHLTPALVDVGASTTSLPCLRLLEDGRVVVER